MKNLKTSNKSKREIQHGEYLATHSPELLWGWGSPAGKVRADRRANLLIEAAAMTKEGNFLEIGCGNGNFTEKFLRSGGNLVAVDISPDLIGAARRRNLPKEQITFVCDRFEEYKSPILFDAIVGSSVLHHLDIKTTLENINSLLKPGGRLAFAEPNMLNPQIFAERTFLRNRLDWISPDETAFIRWGITSKLRQVGFENIKVLPFDWLHPVIPESLISFVSKVGSIFEKTPVLREFSGSLLIFAIKP